MTSEERAMKLPAGLVPIGHDALAEDLAPGLMLGLGGSGEIVVATAERREVVVFGERRLVLLARTWRATGPLPRSRLRTVPNFATLESLALERDVRLARAFTTGSWRWRWGPPRIGIGDRWLTPRAVAALLPPPDADRDSAVARVADVRALYGRMLSDIAYRIENSAMFDSGVPLTARFEEALAQWEATDAGTPASEVARLAARVKVSFDAARANAETLNLGHLPETARADARRAAGAARLAAEGATAAERAAAQEQVIRILTALGIYYLPDPARAKLEAR